VILNYRFPKGSKEFPQYLDDSSQGPLQACLETCLDIPGFTLGWLILLAVLPTCAMHAKGVATYPAQLLFHGQNDPCIIYHEFNYVQSAQKVANCSFDAACATSIPFGLNAVYTIMF
jgi:hypothetical protein